MTRHALLPAILLLGCNGASPSPQRPPTASATFELLRATPALAGSFDAARPLVRDGETFRSVGAITLALTGRTMRLANPAVEGASLELDAEGLAPVPATPHERGVAFVNALPDGDVAVLASPSFVEETRVLRTTAAHLARYRARLGPGLASLRSREGRIEATDAQGKVLLGTAPVFAVDAKGTRVELSPRVSLDGRSADRARPDLEHREPDGEGACRAGHDPARGWQGVGRGRTRGGHHPVRER